MLIVDKFVAAILSGESRIFTTAMLSAPALEVIRHASVEHRIGLICHDVDPEIVLSRHNIFLSCRAESRHLEFSLAHSKRFLGFARNDKKK